MMRTLAWRRFFMFGLVSLVIAGCLGLNVAPAPTSTPSRTPMPTRVIGPGVPGTFEPAACPFALPEDYVQGQNVDCGYLVVPENRERADTRPIRLAVAVFHPEGGATRSDAVLYLSGGPGGSVLEGLRYEFDSTYGPVLATGRDLILFDQRGVGRSEPALDCPEVDALSREILDREYNGRTLTDAEILDLLVSRFERCAADLRQHADLSAYHSAANAADVALLRRVLDYEQVNLWGASYGTRLALTVMRDHPEGIRSVVLDSVYPLEADLYVEGPANARRAFDRLFASCAENTVCREAYPDLESVFNETVATLNADPVTGTITDTLTGEAYPAVLTGDSLVGLVFQILYDSELRLMLPQLIYDAHAGNFAALNKFRGAMLARASAISRGMTFSVQCHEEITFSSEADFEAALAYHPEFTGLYAHSVADTLSFRVCERWDAGAAPPVENEPVSSDIPTLVMTGEFDPITPPRWGQQAAAHLSRSYVFEYPHVGHGTSFVDGCPREMLLAFLEEPMTSPDAMCLSGMRR
jgi:pimeloyl-ACP methyl ester carboxylesterase